MEAENFSPGKVEAGGEDKALGRDCTQHQLIKLAGEKEEEWEQEKEKDKGKKEKNMPGNQHQLIKLVGGKEEEREQEKEEHILVKVIMQYHMQYVNLSILSTSTAI